MAIPDPRKLPLRLRLALWYMVFLLATVGGVSVFLFAALENNLLKDVDDELGLRALHVERAIGANERWPGNGQIASGVLELAPLEEFSAPGIYVQIINLEGEVLASSPNLPGGQLPMKQDMIAAALAGHVAYATVPAGRERVRVLARPVVSGGSVFGAVLVGESLHSIDITLRRTQQLLVIGGASAAILALVSGWWLTAHGLRPIAEVTRVARRIAATGQFEQRIEKPQTHDEVAELTATFNEMLASLEKTFQRQREFIADVSHELRGPLMVIRGNLDLLKRNMPEAEREECAIEVAEEVDRMSRLVSDLLFLAEVDAQEVVEHLPVAFHEVVHEVWERARGVDGSCHEILLAHNDPATVLGDRDRLGQMLWNLVENALRYTPERGQVILSLRNHQQLAELIVADTGVGISAKHLPRVFERFYRIDRARSHDRGSTGLGLAIVKQVAEAHGGQVRVRSELGAGSSFTVAIPIDRS